MALAALQGALARLFVDAEARALFTRDPAAAARALGLDGEDARLLAALESAALERFAASLVGKRVLALTKAMPATALALGPDFARLARDHARAIPDQGGGADAARFARDLARLARKGRLAPRWIADLARYEAAGAVAARRRWIARFALYRWPVAAMAAALRAGDAPDASARLTLAVWLRFAGGALAHRCAA